MGTLWVVGAIATIAIVGCSSSANERGGDRLRGDAGNEGGNGGSLADGGTCEQKRDDFVSFVAAHQACERDSDCTIIGDCDPNADFTAVRADVSDEAYRLMQARCRGPSDGPLYDAVCSAGKCTEVQRSGAECGTPKLPDAGRDGASAVCPPRATGGKSSPDLGVVVSGDGNVSYDGPVTVEAGDGGGRWIFGSVDGGTVRAELRGTSPPPLGTALWASLSQSVFQPIPFSSVLLNHIVLRVGEHGPILAETQIGSVSTDAKANTTVIGVPVTFAQICDAPNESFKR